MSEAIPYNLLKSIEKNIDAAVVGSERTKPYRVQGNMTLHSIDYPLYVLDNSVDTTLTLPLVSETLPVNGAVNIITLLNPCKCNFVISGNGINIVKSGAESATITLTEYQCIKLILIDIGQDHDSLWYELITIPASTGGGITLSQVKSDIQIADTIAKVHAAGSDNQDLSNLVVKVTNKSLVLDTEIAKIHAAGSDDQDLSGKVDKVTGKGLSTNDYTTAEQTKLSGLVSQVQSDWNAGTGMGQILNKPTIPTVSGSNTGDETATRISGLNHNASLKSALLDADEITGQDSAITFSLIRTTWTSVKAFLKTYFDGLYNSKRLVANLAAPVVTSGTTEKILLQLAIPANRAVSGSGFLMWIIGNSSSTGTLIFKVRAGAGGVITDAIAWTAITSAAQAANKRAGFDALATVQNATALYTDGIAYAGTLQLETVIAAAANSVIAISGIWYISLTVICSSGTFTGRVGSIEEIR